jgi:hypothetical protein
LKYIWKITQKLFKWGKVFRKQEQISYPEIGHPHDLLSVKVTLAQFCIGSCFIKILFWHQKNVKSFFYKTNLTPYYPKFLVQISITFVKSSESHKYGKSSYKARKFVIYGNWPFRMIYSM